MKQEKSCGGVILREQNGLREYLVLHSIQGHWTLCKGHVEGDETEHDTALREIREETGLSVDFVDGFRETITYAPRPGVTKNVVFFLARLSGGTLACQPEEVEAIRFLPLGRALAALTHPSDRDTLQKAHAFLESRRPMPTPLYDSLRALADTRPLRLDMPGHHGLPLPGGLSWPSELDFTENGATGNLFGDEADAIQAAEALWAASFGFDQCLFLTGGSTQGIHAGLALLAEEGGSVALDRGSHRAVYHALALLGLTPRFLPRPWLAQEGVTGPISPETVADVLSAHPEIKTICITSPTYYGVLSDVPAIAAVCHARGARLMVDAAHGAHLPFLGYTGYQAADVVVMSAHKTLPAPGQSALLFANGFPLFELQRWGSVYGTSSPSYVLMAALDGVRHYMETEGTARYQSTVRLVHELRRRRPALTARAPLELDPARLVLTSPDGFALANALRSQGIYPEMADWGHVVCILTCADGAAQFDRLEKALDRSGLSGPCAPVPAPPEPPPMVLTPRQALFAPRKRLPLGGAAEQISACQIAPYPPGVPVIAPGELIQKKHLAYLVQIGYNRDGSTAIDVVR